MDRGAWWGYSPWGCQESDMTERLNTNTAIMVKGRAYIFNACVSIVSSVFHRRRQKEVQRHLKHEPHVYKALSHLFSDFHTIIS